MKRMMEDGLVVIMRYVSLDHFDCIIKALYEGGVRIVEPTFNPLDPDTIQKNQTMIYMLKEAGMMVGAGTAVCTDYVRAAKEAGAEFIVSPGTDPAVISLAKELGMGAVPGAFTPTEILMAHQAGADVVKMFPTTVNELGYLQNIFKPLSHIPFMCTGGVNEETAHLFLRAGAVAVGTGASILKPELLKEERYDEIRRLAFAHRVAIDQVKFELN